LELFHDQVFCFTPKGKADRAAAPGQCESTFAYAVHTDVGKLGGFRLQSHGKFAPLFVGAAERRRGRGFDSVAQSAPALGLGIAMRSPGKARAAIPRARPAPPYAINIAGLRPPRIIDRLFCLAQDSEYAR